MVSEPLILAGQLLAIAFASGLDVYATIAVLGLAARLGLAAGLPPGLAALAQPLVIGSAAALYLVESVVDKLPRVDALWDAVHTAIRPAAAALLAVSATAPHPFEVQIGAALLAGATALGAHASKAGLRTAVTASRWRGRLVPALSVAEDVAAITIAFAVVREPGMATAIAAGALLAIVAPGPVLWRAFLLGVRAMAARARGLFQRREWLGVDRIPPALRVVVPRSPLGPGVQRAARASIKGLPGVGAYRHGWIVIAPEGAHFLYRSLLGPRARPLPPGQDAEVHRGLWADVVSIRSAAGEYTIFLYCDGPPPAVAVAALAPDALAR